MGKWYKILIIAGAGSSESYFAAIDTLFNVQ